MAECVLVRTGGGAGGARPPARANGGAGGGWAPSRVCACAGSKLATWKRLWIVRVGGWAQRQGTVGCRAKTPAPLWVGPEALEFFEGAVIVRLQELATRWWRSMV
jgi:hypothetical protein